MGAATSFHNIDQACSATRETRNPGVFLRRADDVAERYASPRTLSAVRRKQSNHGYDVR
jgi:hypothetical protein